MPYLKLLQPLIIRETAFPNRIVFPPVQTNYAASNGEATDRLVDFYKNLARNQVGLTIVGATGISPFSRLGDHAFCLYDEKHVSSGEKLFGAIRKAGSIPAVQLNHGGRVMNPALAGGRVVGPSAIASPAGGAIPHELTEDEVEEVIDQFVRAAVNAEKAGALMVEFHGAHSFLLNQFMSPAANQRTDQYGGSTENRALIVRKILRKTRKKVGKGFVLGLRMSVEEYVEGGLTVGQSAEMLKLFVDDGLDIIHVSAGGMDSGGRMVEEAAKGNLVKLAGQIKQHVGIPVIAVGGILSLDQAEAVLEDGHADMVAIGRALIADPELVTKTINNRKGEIEECTGCLQCFFPTEKPGMTCSVNENL